MSVDLKDLQLKLAEHKVYDAWQYVNSLQHYLEYMKLSYKLIDVIDKNRKEHLAELHDLSFEIAKETGSVSITERDLDTSIKIGNHKINDSTFQEKNTIEFFHYARLSTDILFQIVNAALLGDNAIDIEDTHLINNVLRKIANIPGYKNIVTLLSNNKNNDYFKYVQAVDNYIKHIKSILITISNNMIFNFDSNFKINKFVYKGILYEEKDALQQVENTFKYITDLVDNVLNELIVCLPLISNVSTRIQELRLKMQFHELENGSKLEYATFFIDVNDISELPCEIKVLPLVIKPNNEIYSFDMQFDTIFIRQKESEDILGYATLKNGLDTNEIYRIYDVHQGKEIDYIEYLAGFKNRQGKLNINFYALQECTIISYK